MKPEEDLHLVSTTDSDLYMTLTDKRHDRSSTYVIVFFLFPREGLSIKFSKFLNVERSLSVSNLLGSCLSTVEEVVHQWYLRIC